MFRTLLVVPYPKLEKTAQKIYQNLFKDSDFYVDIQVIKAEEIESSLSQENYDLYIGRGKSAAILKRLYSDKGVLEIPITGYDVIRSLQEVKHRFNSRKIAMLLSSAGNHDVSLLTELFDTQVTILEVEELVNHDNMIIQLLAEGYDTVIGGYSITSEATACGINTWTIETGEEAVTQIFHEARRMMDTIFKERERRKIYHTITQNSSEGIIYADNQGIISLVNRKILQVIPREHGAIQGKFLKEAYPFFEEKYVEVMEQKQALYNEIQQIQNTSYSVNYEPVIVGDIPVGVVITCQSVKKIQQIESQIRKKLSEQGLVASYTFANIIHKSEEMESAVSVAGKYAQVASNILIVGETGTGKELMAQSMHNAGKHRNGPFVAVNCAAIPENLLESELFGYVDGAFTGSRKGGKMGYFEQAHNGTLFLDEISEIPINFQGKLLRVLQERQVRRIGDDKVIDVDTRIIAATNRNLRQMVTKKEFRQDLLYRLDVLKIYIPALRERKEDILPLFYSFIKEYNSQFGKDIGNCSPGAEELLSAYQFEGNIRELRNIAERVAVICESREVSETLMGAALYPEDVFAEKSSAVTTQEIVQEPSSAGCLEMTERNRIIEALEKTGGRKTAAAELLGMDRSTLWRKMKSYNI